VSSSSSNAGGTHHSTFSISGGHRTGYSYLRRPSASREQQQQQQQQQQADSASLGTQQGQQRVRVTAAAASKAAARAAERTSEVPGFDRHVTQSIYKRDISRT
jgi:hypothetical protein